MRNRFDRQLEQLNNGMIEMGALVERAINSAVSALMQQDVQKARQAIAFDTEVDRKEKEIESLCLRLLLQQQPVARDLRQISSALKMITDMERIGDQAADISELTIMMAKTPYGQQPEHIPQMAKATIGMVTESVEAFVKQDAKLARKVCRDDDIVDGLFDQVKKDLIQQLKKDGDNGEQAIDLLMVAKYLERIGDHATNIAEWVEFAVTGVHKNEKIL